MLLFQRVSWKEPQEEEDKSHFPALIYGGEWGEQILSHKTPLVRSSGGKPEREVQVRHSIFLNNLQAGKACEFITNLIVHNHGGKEKLVQKQRIYCTSAPTKSMSFIIVIQSHEKLKAFFS